MEDSKHCDLTFTVSQMPANPFHRGLTSADVTFTLQGVSQYATLFEVKQLIEKNKGIRIDQ